MRTKTTLLIAVFCLFSTLSFAATNIKGNKNIVTQQFPINDYDVINIAGSMNFTYEQSNAAPYLEVTIDENILPYLEIETTNGKLTVGVKKENNRNSYNISPTVYKIKTNSRALKEINSAGSGNFVFNSPISGNPLKINMAGSGNVKLQNSFTASSLDINMAGSGNVTANSVKVDDLNCSLASSGNIKVDGSVKKAKYSLAGSGNIKAYDCKAESANASVAGSGNIQLTVSEELNASIAGSGNISYQGTPTHVYRDVQGSGRIRNSN